MITIGLCLIHFGIALLLYQLYGGLADGHWTPYTVMTLWQAFFGSPTLQFVGLERIVYWLLGWPLSLALVLSGTAVLGLVFGLRRLAKTRRHRQRRRWIAKACRELGYGKWNVPKVLAELDDRLSRDKAARKKQVG